MSLVIDVREVGKLYRLGSIGTGTLSHDLKRWWASARGLEDPYAKVGSINDRTREANDKEYVWALQNLNFQVNQGEVVGIIGKNGAGKSTLLKLLSRITAPTKGTVKIKGRIGSLLEVGTGFHPEMTGRENIFMNGTVLGMRKQEISRKFDEIVDFAGVAKYIDTPVKRYSSGMMVRLGFAVAAFLEPEILIVDEVLAVGDADFQKKALGKMKDVSSGSGRTILFVSHNLRSVKAICSRGILLNNGSIVRDSDTSKVVNYYLEEVSSGANADLSWDDDDAPGSDEVKLVGIRLMSEDRMERFVFETTEQIILEIQIKIISEIRGARMVVHLLTDDEEIVFSTTNQFLVSDGIYRIGLHKLNCTIPENLLNQGRYKIRISMGIPGQKLLLPPQIYLSFNTHLAFYDDKGFNTNLAWPGVIAPTIKWEHYENEF